MKLPTDVKAIRAAYVAKFPVPRGAAGTAFEEGARQWSIGLAEQVAFSTGDARWGMKRADAGRPVSKDTLTFNGTPRMSWDLLVGTGTGKPTLNADPDSIDTSKQVFVPVVPTDHLGGTPEPPPAEPPVVVPADCAQLHSNLVALADEVRNRLLALERSTYVVVEDKDAAPITTSRELWASHAHTARVKVVRVGPPAR
jgi:hypothetical protein